MYKQYHQDAEDCRMIQKQYGANYYPATKLLSKRVREAVYVLYAWVRLPDEIVDNPENPNPIVVKQKLETWIKDWADVFSGSETSDPVMRAAVVIFKKYDITEDLQQSFLQAMLQDINTNRYADYESLKGYMYGSASVVGVMFTKIVGAKSDVFSQAETNGYAMQLTNFLRDVGEDWNDRARIYMPLDELASFGLDEGDIAEESHLKTPWQDFMKWQIARNRVLYSEAWPAIRELKSYRARLAARSATLIYSDILRSIEKNKYDVFTKRAEVRIFRKLYLIMVCIFNPPKELIWKK